MGTGDGGCNSVQDPGDLVKTRLQAGAMDGWMNGWMDASRRGEGQEEAGRGAERAVWIWRSGGAFV